MLPILNEQNSGVSRTLRGVLAAGALGVLALPTIYLAQANGAGGEQTKTAAKSATGDNTPRVDFLPQRSKIEEHILEQLDTPTKFDFIEMPLQETMYYLKDQHGIEIQLDLKQLKETGIAEDTPVTRQLEDIKLGPALRLLLQEHNLTYLVHDDMLLITTQDRASSSEMLVTRTYPVGDLGAGESFEGLKETIVSTIASQSWHEVGGNGQISVVPEAKSFVVTQSYDVHNEIVQLLRSLRAARDLSAKK